MSAEKFLASKLRFKSRMALLSTAVSSLIMIIAVAVAQGYRKEITRAVSIQSSDVLIYRADARPEFSTRQISTNPAGLDQILQLPFVQDCSPVITLSGIVKNDQILEGVLLRSNPAVESGQIIISTRLASRLGGVKVGDALLCYILSDKVKARKLKVCSVESNPVELDKNLTIQCNINDLRRICSWQEDEAGALSISLKDSWKRPKSMAVSADKISEILLLNREQGKPVLLCSSAASRYETLFGWLGLINSNVLAILLLMSIVAGVNMICALLIFLMRSVNTIGMFKAMGMTQRSIKSLYIKIASRSVATGLAIGNGIAFILCLIQSLTHVVELNPDNYFVSYVPIHLKPLTVVLVDIVSFLLIMGIMRVATRYIVRIDPAESTRAE